MFTTSPSASHRSGRNLLDLAPAVASSALLLFLIAVFVAPGCSQTATGSAWRTLPRAEAEPLLRLLAEPVRREGDPQETKPRFELTGSALEVRIANTTRAVMPVIIRYMDSTNVNCRLAVYTADRKHSSFVALPLNASYDSCLGMERLGIADLNHDGIVDLIYKVYVPSNRTAERVWEGAVYLSTKDAAAPYCFAPDISRTVTLYKPPETVETFIANEVKRRGLKVLDCYKPSD